jgi:hypothetical protein
MITTHDGKQTARIGELSFFYLLNPGPIDSNWNLMFRFASSRTGVATDTFSIVDYESVFHIV